MVAISRNKQLIAYAFLVIFGVVFFIYFYRQATITEFTEAKVKARPKVNKVVGEVKINTDFFETDKFRNLRFDSLPAVSFPVGKRNPFEPY